jgi:hypothetical protein
MKSFLIILLLVLNIFLFNYCKKLQIKYISEYKIKNYYAKNIEKDKEHSDYKEQKALIKLKNTDLENYINFIVGMGIGYGLSVDASEELKMCFIKKKNNQKIVEEFFNRTENNENIELLNIDKNNQAENQLNQQTEERKIQKKITKTFTKQALEFFANFRDCAPFRETIFSFIKNRLLNIGIKGIAYAAGGLIGLLIKGTYDLLKLLTEIKNFYNLKTKRPIDYINLGSSLGKIIYYTQNLIIRKRKF